MEHEMDTLESVDSTMCVSNGDEKTYSPPRLIILTATDVESGTTTNIAEASGGGLLGISS